MLALASRRCNRMLPGPTNTIADTAVLVAGSPRLSELARYCSPDDMKRDKSTRAKLGWFTSPQGERRWGIELVDTDEDLC
ncbi:hypothetical protein F5Y01DRAFT_276621 [Xylaria sp. FL0043]|nr:hypothetical protein F5Y01DRAFT_276621 [Xylaria sp. FL0043]